MSTATEILQRELDRRLSKPPEIHTAEEYYKWCIDQITLAAQELAAPHIRALVEIEGAKPPKPIVFSGAQNVDSDTVAAEAIRAMKGQAND